MNKELLKVSLRQNAIIIPEGTPKAALTETTTALVANAAKLGFGFSEELLHAINAVQPTYKVLILDVLKEIKGVSKNWTPLVKGWDKPTGETRLDHVITLFANLFKSRKGTTLQCGHIIPNNTFPLERYNGCPFCGTPFELGTINYSKKNSKLTVLDLWTHKDLKPFLVDLLTSKTALDASQNDSLKGLLAEVDLPDDIDIAMKETRIAVIDALVENNRSEAANRFFDHPNDILRYLWFKHTGFLQLIEPKTIVQRAAQNFSHRYLPEDQSILAQFKSKKDLKLKYNRAECKVVANWLNNLELDAQKSCEIMHPKRGMWVRFIRALRLTEFAKRKGFEKLATLLDVFYRRDYEVAQGKIDYFKLRNDSDRTFALLKQRPGLFARSLFANILWFGPDETLYHFKQIGDKIPARLVITLAMYADTYFQKNLTRTVKPLGGINKAIPAPTLLQLYNEEQLQKIRAAIQDATLAIMEKRFAQEATTNKTIFIDEALYKIPVAIGDRSETVQDLPSALMGTRFPVEGNKVRLFMQWGTGLPAQHLDMDLSCRVAYGDRTDYCSYSQLTIAGCKHSGDVIHIPEKVGTAEYIELDLAALTKSGAKYVSFTCNAYSVGNLAPNMVVGWMNSAEPMRISQSTGVAYNPAHVQHQVRITQNLNKGLVFGVLAIAAREIIWLEMPFGGQVVYNLNTTAVEALIEKLDSKLNIGSLLNIKAKAQGLCLVENENEADEAYTAKWALNTAAVTQLLVD